MQSKSFIRKSLDIPYLILLLLSSYCRHFIEKRTLAQDSQPPAIPYFEYQQLPSDNGLAKFRVNLKPNTEGHAGTHFFTEYRFVKVYTNKRLDSKPSLQLLITELRVKLNGIKHLRRKIATIKKSLA